MVKKAYPSKTWALRVSKMSDNQVYAVFLSLKRRGKI